MLVLLETKMADHKKLTEELQFDMHIQFPAIGHSVGIVIMWRENSLQVDEVAVNSHGIHAMVKAKRWIVHSENRVSFFNDPWINNLPAIRSLIHGPLTREDMSKTVANVHQNGIWDLSTLSHHPP
ncbi:hypothetical protein A4A49_61382, partial [Nicotiana attenuata]